MPELLTQNGKLKETSKKTGLKVVNFGIPAYQTQTGKRTCPFADKCVAFCYARKGAYSWGNVKPAYEWRYAQTQKDDFADIMQKEIDRKRPDVVRIHDSGDFYSPAYLEKWVQIIENNPRVTFYAYTNSVPFFRGRTLPENFTVIFSDSGKFAESIDRAKERHTKIFKSHAELNRAGYVDASKNDLNAIGENHKIGLVFH